MTPIDQHAKHEIYGERERLRLEQAVQIFDELAAALDLEGNSAAMHVAGTVRGASDIVVRAKDLIEKYFAAKANAQKGN